MVRLSGLFMRSLFVLLFSHSQPPQRILWFRFSGLGSCAGTRMRMVMKLSRSFSVFCASIGFNVGEFHGNNQFNWKLQRAAMFRELLKLPVFMALKAFLGRFQRVSCAVNSSDSVRRISRLDYFKSVTRVPSWIKWSLRAVCLAVWEAFFLEPESSLIKISERFQRNFQTSPLIFRHCKTFSSAGSFSVALSFALSAIHKTCNVPYHDKIEKLSIQHVKSCRESLWTPGWRSKVLLTVLCGTHSNFSVISCCSYRININ